MNKEIYNLQIARGIAALIVVFGHLTPPFINKYLPNTQIGVSIFFCLSGFIMVHTFKESDGFFSFMKKRIARIYPSYLIISLPMIVFFSFQAKSIIYALHSCLFIPWVDWASNPISQNTRYSISNPIAWTLFYEFYFYIIFSISKSLFPSSRIKVVISTSIIILSGIILTRISFGADHHLGYFAVTWRSITGNLCLLPFIFGMLGSLIYSTAYKPRIYIFLLIPASTVMLKLAGGNTGNQQLSDAIFSGIPCSILLIYMARTAPFTGYIFNRLHAVGVYSYSLYLFHANFYLISGKLNDKLHLPPMLQILISIFFITSSIIISKWLYLHLESRLLFKVKNSKPNLGSELK